MKQYQITSRPRHLRYIFFIDEKYSYEKLFKLICTNQKLWGGRYNPIIPVRENTISEKYIRLIENYDPDYIFYSNGINPEIIKKLRLFNPAVFCNMDEVPCKEDILGVDVFYLLSLFDANLKITPTQELWKTKSPLLDFYNLNFGLDSDTFMHEYEIGKKYSQTIITPENFGNLNEILHREKPIIKAGLSRHNILTKILRNLKEINYGDCEIVLAKNKSAISDLIYYWNRLMYETRSIFYITVEELNLLASDKYFGALLHDLSGNDSIKVVSTSLDKSEIEGFINEKLNPIAFYRTFKYKDINNFPFDILDSQGHYERDYNESFKTQILISEKGLFYLPKLSFTDKVSFFAQKWAVDIELLEVRDTNFRNEIKFPFTSETQYIIKGVKGRINRMNNLSVFIHNQRNTSDSLEIHIPPFQSLLKQLISNPVIQGEAINTQYVYSTPHDSSNKLSAFLKAFNYDFTTIDDFFTDKFWVGLFEELITNEKVAGDSISFEEIKQKAIDALKEKGIELGQKGETYQNEENLNYGLKETLGELCEYSVFLKGFNLKCDNCSSKFWYPINEVNEIINCKGCLENFDLPIEPKFAYKLNDLIKNNIFQSKTHRDGNLTVIRTLASIYNRSRHSFGYSPQLNIFTDIHSGKPSNELDIVCSSDGKFIIGEAKHNSKGFFEERMKSLKSLVEISKIIYPDKIILACYDDEHEKLDKAKQGLLHLFNKWEYQPEIETLLLLQPDDFNVGGHRYFYY